MVKQSIKSLVEKYIDLEAEIIKKLDELPMQGQECGCDEECESIQFIKEGMIDNFIEKRCMNCGGYMEGE